MNKKDFAELVVKETEHIKDVFGIKADEYNLEDDRLGFFKRTAAVLDEKPDEALLGMMVKHIVSIFDMVKSSEKFTEDRWKEKVTDCINYLLLLFALEKDLGFKEEKKNNEHRR